MKMSRAASIYRTCTLSSSSGQMFALCRFDRTPSLFVPYRSRLLSLSSSHRMPTKEAERQANKLETNPDVIISPTVKASSAEETKLEKIADKHNQEHAPSTGANIWSSSKHLRDTHYDTENLGARQDEPPIGVFTMPHPVYSEEDLYNVKITHVEPNGAVERLAYLAVRIMRWGFDTFSGYKRGKLTENKMLTRIIFLETVAGVPGMVAGMVRHLNSLRRMQRDHGWIHTLLAEAENERMHLMTAVHLKQPGIVFRGLVLFGQGVFVNGFFLAYLMSPRFCHRFVGYLEEEAVKTYTTCLQHIDSGRLAIWQTKQAPRAAIQYWRLKENASMRDMILAIRADEAHHRVVNHTLASLKPDDYNPFYTDVQPNNPADSKAKEIVKQIEQREEDASASKDVSVNSSQTLAKKQEIDKPPSVVS